MHISKQRLNSAKFKMHNDGAQWLVLSALVCGAFDTAQPHLGSKFAA